MSETAGGEKLSVRKIGFIGVGHLAGFLVAGAMRSDAKYQIVLSPRNAEKSADLAKRYAVSVAASNQEVVDRSELVVISVLPRFAKEVLDPLHFKPPQIVLSVMAGVSCNELSSCIAPARVAAAMMPGMANAIGIGPSILYPDLKDCEEFLQTFGPVHVFTNWDEFETASVFGGFSGASFSFMNQIMDWFTMRGLKPDTARKLVAQTLRGNAEAILQSDDPMASIVSGIATKGGITELATSILEKLENRSAWHEALDGIEKRVKRADS